MYRKKYKIELDKKPQPWYNEATKEREVIDMTEYIYVVNGTEHHTTEVWGQAWKDAKAQATAEHATIERAVINGDKVRYEFYAKGGCFLADRFYNEELVKVW